MTTWVIPIPTYSLIFSLKIWPLSISSSILFSTEIEPEIPKVSTGTAGKAKNVAIRSQRNGIIKNFLSSKYLNETT